MMMYIMYIVSFLQKYLPQHLYRKMYYPKMSISIVTYAIPYPNHPFILYKHLQ